MAGSSVLARLASAILIAFLPASVAAQSLSPRKVFGRYQQSVWQEPQGLPQNTVLSMTRTRDGYLWLGTIDGAARFDGVRFTVFDTANTPEIHGTLITSVFEDRAGALWLATDNGGLARYADGRFARVSSADGLVDDHVRTLIEDRRGDLWIATVAGLSRLRNGRFTNFTDKEGLPHPSVTALAEDNEGHLWIGTSNGLVRLADDRMTVYAQRDGLPSAAITALAWDPAGQLWIGTSAGLARWQNGRITSGAPERLPELSIMALCVDRDGALWVGTAGQGLLRRAGDRFATYTTAHGLPGDRIATIYQDPDGDVWAGTSGGLVRFRQSRFGVLTTDDGLARDYAVSIYQDATDAIWVAADEGLTRYHDGSVTTYSTRDGLPDMRVSSMTADGTGRLLVGSGNALATFDGERFRPTPGPTLPSAPTVYAVLSDRSGGTWIGTTRFGAILTRQNQTYRYSRETGLHDNFILSMYEDRVGAIWIGTLQGGVSRVVDGNVTTWTTDQGLGSNQVLSFYEDRDGALWIGTHGGGLSRFKDGRLATIGVAAGLFNGVIFQILEDDDGNLWMSCNKGIFRVSLEDLNAVADARRTKVTSIVYGVADGMLSSECNQGSPGGARMRDGTLWFPTIQGVVVVDPRQRESHPPRVLVEKVTVDRAPVPVEGDLRLSPGQHNLEIEYTGLSWHRPQQVAFRYRLAGLDSEWVEAGTRRTAYYSYLPPGAYTFTVIADNGEGVWNTEGASVRVTVLPAFYQRRWFVALIATLGLASLMVAWKYRVAQLQHAQSVQQAFSRQLIASQESERKRIAGELHDSLGQHLLIITNRAVLGKTVARDASQVQEQLEAINASALQAIGEVRTIAQNLRPINLDRLGLAAAIEEMVEKASGVAGVELSADVGSVDGLLEPDSQIVVYRIIQESVSNILRHSGAARAGVEVWAEAGALQIVVRDNGRGIDAPTSEKAGGSGLGLVGIAERVRILGGTHTIVSTPEQGTTVSVRIPVRPSTLEGTHAH